MSDKEDDQPSSKANIPKLTGDNYTSWSLRIQSHLRRKGLFQYCTELADTYTAPQTKKRHEASDIIIQHLDDISFDAIITPDNISDPYTIWSELKEKFASQSFNNKGRIWLNFIRHEFKGDITTYIKECRKLINELAIVNMNVPEDILSYTILAKLNSEHYHHVDSIMLNEEIVKSPNKVLIKLTEIAHIENSRVQASTKVSNSTATALFKQSKSSHRGKPRAVHFCSPGHHNELASHPEEKCWNLHPHLRPPKKEKASNHLTTDDACEENLVEANLSGTILFNTHKQINPKKMVLDSGATHHIINSAALMNDIAPCNIKIGTGNPNHVLSAEGIGSATIIDQNGRKLVLKNVLLVPEINRCLLSLSRLIHSSSKIKRIGLSNFIIHFDNKFVLSGSLKNHLFELNNADFEINSKFSSYFTDIAQPDWHTRLGHPSSQYLMKLFPKYKDDHKCDICKLCKMTKLSFSSHFDPASNLLEVIHLDLVGPFSTQSQSGFLYFLMIVDQFSGFKTVKFLKSKSEVFEKFLEFVKTAENQTGKTIKKLISDNGGEFKNNSFKDFCAEKGIIHNFSPPFTPQNNGIAERANRTVLNKARCILLQSRLPPSFWAEAVNTATDLCNLLPFKSNKFRISFNVWFGKKFEYSKLKPFGCQSFFLTPEHLRAHKLSPTGEKGILLGYVNNFSTLKIYSTSSKNIIYTKHAIFDEQSFPGLSNSAIISPFDDVLTPSTADEQQEKKVHTQPPITHPTETNQPENPEPEQEFLSSEPTVPSRLISSQISSENILNYNRRGVPLVNTTYSIPEVFNISGSLTAPTTFSQATNSADSTKWKEAIEKELNNLKLYNVWTEVDKPESVKPLRLTWVFRIKTNSENEPMEHKARLCVQGFNQVEGIDYETTFAPTGKMSSLRLLISFALQNDLQFHQVDVKSAFLNAEVKEDIYVYPPQGVTLESKQILKLNKALYGLKQAPQEWHNTFSSWLLSIGFQRCEAEMCVYWRNGTWLYVHVDDIAIFSKEPEVFKAELRNRFKIKDLGPAQFLLGMNIFSTTNSITLSQSHYIDSILDRFNLKDLTPSSTPQQKDTWSRHLRKK